MVVRSRPSRVRLPIPPGYDFSVSPRRDIYRLRSDLEELFEQAWGAPRFGARRCFRPAVDCFRTLDPPQLVVAVELAGVDPDDVHVVAGERGLVIAGARRRPSKGKGGQLYQQMEIDYGPFERRIPLPDDVRPEEATATYEHGILKVVFPTAAKPHASERVPIPIRRAR